MPGFSVIAHRRGAPNEQTTSHRPQDGERSTSGRRHSQPVDVEHERLDGAHGGTVAYRDVMPRWFYKACRQCAIPASVDVPISRQGYCPRCGLARALAALTDLHERRGTYNERYREALAQGRVGRPRNGVGGSPVKNDHIEKVESDP